MPGTNSADRSSTEFIPALRFDRLTPLFDAVAALAARDGALKRRVLDHAAIRGGEKVADIGCGTGTLAIAAAGRGAAVTGLDADPKILRRAREKAARSDARIRFDEAMSDELPYPEGCFDVVLSTLFFHHLSDASKRRTAAEIVRVLRSEGRVVIGDVGRPHDPLMRAAVRLTVQMLDGTATTSLNVAGGLPEVLGEAGFREVEVRDRMRTPVGTCEILTARR